MPCDLPTISRKLLATETNEVMHRQLAGLFPQGRLIRRHGQTVAPALVAGLIRDRQKITQESHRPGHKGRSYKIRSFKN